MTAISSTLSNHFDKVEDASQNNTELPAADWACGALDLSKEVEEALDPNEEVHEIYFPQIRRKLTDFENKKIEELKEEYKDSFLCNSFVVDRVSNEIM